MSDTPPALARYREKRDFSRTPEPAGKTARPGKALSFVVQRHAARRLHYDFRLEWRGVMKSWAVTRGPSMDPADKRLAVEVEDHPLDYASFEGTIPKPSYGGGTVQVWDRGTWTPLDPATVDQDLERGELKFVLTGERLRGGFVLVLMRPRHGESETHHNWLLIKERDSAATPGAGDAVLQAQTSVLSGRTMEQIAAGATPVKPNSNAVDETSPRIATRKTAARQPAASAKPAQAQSVTPANRPRKSAAPAKRKPPEMSAAKASGPSPATKSSGRSPAAKSSGEPRATKASGERPAAKSSGEPPATKASREPPATKAARNSPAIGSSSKVAIATARKPDTATEPPRRSAQRPTGAGAEITHPDRVLWPATSDTPMVTKADLAAYYALYADRILAQIGGRPLSVVRAPDGITGEVFFQRHAMRGQSSSIGTVQIDGQPRPYLRVDDATGLAALARISVVELHPWGARADTPESPDRLIFDLDPAEGLNFDAVVAAALELRDRLKKLSLEPFVRVTGGKGLHVVVPVRMPQRANPPGWPEAKKFVRLVCMLMERDAPDRYTTKMAKQARGGRIFLDYLRNDSTSTAIAAWSPRGRPGAPVAYPVPWSMVRPGLNPAGWTLPALLQQKPGRDPWADFNASGGDLRAAIASVTSP